MGNVCGPELTTEENEVASGEIERQLKEDEEKFKKISRLLLLGPGESGKSTIFKQMKILYSKASFDKDRRYRIDAVYNNVVQNMRALLDAHSVLFSEQKVPALKNASTLTLFDKAFPQEVGAQPKITPENAQIIAALWSDAAIQKTYDERSSFQISDSTDYFFTKDNLGRISKPGYLPNNMDVLRTRVRTSGIIEHSYTVQDAEFLVIDVGGQRTERGKWIYVFADVDAIVYVASLSGYDQKLYEDETQNRMVEALQLFKEIVNLTLFPPECSMILFLNKVDLFEEKIKKVDPAKCHTYFQDYKGGCDAEKAKAYFKKKFSDLSATREVKTFFTCAVDTKLMEKMMGATKEIVVNRETKMADDGDDFDYDE
eukprot:g1876.t1